MRNLLETSSVAQSLDGSRLIGSLHSPNTETLSRANRLCKLGAAGRSGVGIASTCAFQLTVDSTLGFRNLAAVSAFPYGR